MGRSARPKPKFLAAKLAEIRRRLKIETYEEMIARLDCSEMRLFRSSIAQYENDMREPPLLVLLQYARLANVFLEVLVDDTLELEDGAMPYRQKSAGVLRGSAINQS